MRRRYLKLFWPKCARARTYTHTHTHTHTDIHIFTDACYNSSFLPFQTGIWNIIQARARACLRVCVCARADMCIWVCTRKLFYLATGVLVLQTVSREGGRRSSRFYLHFLWLVIHAFYFFVLQLILRFYSPYLKKGAANIFLRFADTRHIWHALCLLYIEVL